MADKNYIDNIPLERFDEIIPRRRAVIEAASAQMPKYEYNANIVARELHPGCQYVVVSDIKELEGAKLFTLSPDTKSGTEKLAYFRAGQYISVCLRIGKSVLTRPYSLCGSPKEALDGTYSIVVKRMKGGFASDYILDNWKKGTKLMISAPSGAFCYEPLRDSENVVAVAGGSGIAPFVSLAKAVADGTEDCSLTLLYGSRTEKEILLKDELDAVAACCDKIKIVNVLSDEQKDGYENGFITADIIKKYAPGDDYSVFVCGSQGMYDFISGEFEKLGLPARRLRLDAYGEYKLSEKDTAAAAKDKVFDLTVVKAGGETQTVPARADETLLVALERAGVAAPSRCRSGECGFCRSRLASGSVYMPERVEHRRQFDKAENYIHPCCAYPTSDCTIHIGCEVPEIKRNVKDMQKKSKKMSVVMSVIISAAMGAIAAYLTLKTNPQAAEATPVKAMYISNILMSVVVGLLVSSILPLGKWGRGLASKAKAEPSSFKFTLLNCLPISVGNTLIVSLIVSFFGVFMARSKVPAAALANMPPLPVMWLGSWAKLLLPTLIASYLLAVILSPTVSELIGLSGAGAEVGAAMAQDTSINAKKKKAAKKQ